jgi:hypothetical protein
MVLKQLGKLLLERLDFRAVADLDIRISGIVKRVILW